MKAQLLYATLTTIHVAATRGGTKGTIEDQTQRSLGFIRMKGGD